MCIRDSIEVNHKKFKIYKVDYKQQEVKDPFVWLGKEMCIRDRFDCHFLSKERYIEELSLLDIDILYINTACFGRDFAPLSNSMRDMILQLSYDNNFLILEDDYNGELTYHSKPRQALQLSLIHICLNIITIVRSKTTFKFPGRKSTI